jgi:hypothetical protein
MPRACEVNPKIGRELGAFGAKRLRARHEAFGTDGTGVMLGDCPESMGKMRWFAVGLI